MFKDTCVSSYSTQKSHGMITTKAISSTSEECNSNDDSNIFKNGALSCNSEEDRKIEDDSYRMNVKNWEVLLPLFCLGKDCVK